MKTYWLCIGMFITMWDCKAQVTVFDRNHFNIVNENGMVRLTSENAYNGYLKSMNGSLNDIQLNLNAVVLVQSMIRKSLTEVDQALKTGMMSVQISQLLTEIITESNRIVTTARGQPHLILFAEGSARQVKTRAFNLANEVSGFVLKEDGRTLMDYEKRNALLRKVTLELKVIRALCYSIYKSMYWAKVNGVLRTANPYKNFLNQDTRLSAEILRNVKRLNR